MSVTTGDGLVTLFGFGGIDVCETTERHARRMERLNNPLRTAIERLNEEPFTAEAVKVHKDAVERNAYEKASFTVRMLKGQSALLHRSIITLKAGKWAMKALFCLSVLSAVGAWLVGFAGYRPFDMSNVNLALSCLGAAIIAAISYGIMRIFALKLCSFTDKVEGLSWHVIDISDLSGLRMPLEGRILMSGFARLTAGHDVRLRIHQLGNDPFIEAVRYNNGVPVESVFPCGWTDENTELVQVKGRIIERKVGNSS